jgi:O-antigen/teichoic acid export membrane protein
MAGIKKTFLGVYALNFIGYSCEIVFFVLLFKFLPITEVGIFAWVTAISAFWNLFVDMGLNQTLVREFAVNKCNYSQILKESMRFRLPIFFTGLLVFFGWVMLSKTDANTYRAVFIACTIQVLNLVDGSAISYLKATERQIKANFIMNFYSGSKMLIGMLLFLWLKVNLSEEVFAGLLLAKIVSIFISFMVLIPILKRDARELSPRNLDRSLFFASLKFSGINILTTIQNRLDWLIISTFLMKSDVANYSFANKIYEFLQGVSGVALATIYPYLCANSEDVMQKKKMDNLLKFALFIFSGIAILIILFGQDVSRLLWQTKYDASFFSLKILMIGFPLSYLSGILYYLLISKYNEGNILRVLILSTICQTVSNIILIPRYGITAAACGMVILWFLTAIGNLFVYARFNGMKMGQILKTYFYIVPTIVCSLLLAAVMPNTNFIIRLIGTLLVFTILYKMFFNKVEREYILLGLRGYSNRVKK